MRYRDEAGELDFRTRHKLHREFAVRAPREMRKAEFYGRFDRKWEYKANRRMWRDGRWQESEG